MDAFVKLHSAAGKEIYFAKRHVTYIESCPFGEGSIVHVGEGNHGIHVTETPDEILKWIPEGEMYEY